MGRLKTTDVIYQHYRIDDFIGEGGMGEVYASTNLHTGARVALKVLLPRFDADTEVRRRFVREARAATAIDHPNVITVYDVLDDSEHGTPPVIVMELLRGESLEARLARVRRIALPEAAPIFVDVARALCAAHERGIVHRDLKPANIFLLDKDEAGRVAKVLDFGIAKILEPTQLAVQSYGASTQHGAFLGTIHYMSMEQSNGEKVDTRTDVWSFAVTLVETLSERRPLHYDTISEMFKAFIQKPVPRAQTLLPGLPNSLASMLDECLVKERGKRVANLKRAVSTLEDFVGGVPSTARQSARSLHFLIGGALVLGTAIAVLSRSEAPVPKAPVSKSEPSVESSSQDVPQNATTEALPLLPAQRTDASTSRQAVSEVPVGPRSDVGARHRARVKQQVAQPPAQADAGRPTAPARSSLIIEKLPEQP